VNKFTETNDSSNPGKKRRKPSSVNRTSSKRRPDFLLDPRVSHEQILVQLRSNKLSDEQIKMVSGNKRWIQDYKIRLELVRNPRTPRHIALKFIKDLYPHDLNMICRQSSLHPAIRDLAENYLAVRMKTMRTGDRVTLAKFASGNILLQLMHDPELSVIRAALGNYRLREVDVLFFANDRRVSGEKLSELVSHRKWGNCQAVLKELAINPSVGYTARRRIFEKLFLPYLVTLIHSPIFDENHQKLARFVTRQKVKNMPVADQYIMATSTRKVLIVEMLSACEDAVVIGKLLDNRKLAEKDILEYLKKPVNRSVLEGILGHSRWKDHAQIHRKSVEILKKWEVQESVETDGPTSESED
jgi:hypothetical protein